MANISFEILDAGDYKTPLQIHYDELIKKGDNSKVAKLIKLALELSKEEKPNIRPVLSELLSKGINDKKPSIIVEDIFPLLFGLDEIDQIKMHLKVSMALSEEEIKQLIFYSKEAAKESYKEAYYLMELTQATAEGNANILLRLDTSMEFGSAALNYKQINRFRIIVADLAETVQIILRFCKHPHPDSLKQLENDIHESWKELQAEYNFPIELFGSKTNNFTDNLVNCLILNLTDSHSGLTTQHDASYRLAIRLEYWQDEKGQNIETFLDYIIKRIEDIWKKDDNLAIRAYVSLINALVHVGRNDLGSKTFDYFVKKAQMYNENNQGELNFVIWQGYLIGAFNEFLQSNYTKAYQLIQYIDKKELEKLSDLIISVSGEYARYLSIEMACLFKLKNEIHPEIQEKIGKYTKVAYSLVNSFSDKRNYSGSLYFSSLQNDINYIFSIIQ